MIGYAIAGPMIALLVSMGYTKYATRKGKRDLWDVWMKQNSTNITTLEIVSKNWNAQNERIAALELRQSNADTETLKKVMQTVMPIAKAVNKLNQEVGL